MLTITLWNTTQRARGDTTPLEVIHCHARDGVRLTMADLAQRYGCPADTLIVDIYSAEGEEKEMPQQSRE